MPSEQLFNNLPHPKPKEFEAHAKAAASPVWISQHPVGAPLTSIHQSTFTANNLYWMNFSNTKVIHSLIFLVTFKPGSPLHDQQQRFAFPGGYGGTVTTPFGVPFWGGNPIIGPAVLHVIADGVTVGTVNFNVVP